MAAPALTLPAVSASQLPVTYRVVGPAMLNGNMLCCVARQGLMVRVGAEGEAAALARPAAQPCMGTGRRMAGFVMVDHDGLATPQDVVSWLRLAHAYVKTLPPKPVGKSTPK